MTAAPAARRLSTPLVVSAWIALAVVAALVLPDGEVNYDLQYALDWGRAATEGEAPDYELRGSPTPHPLTTAMTTVAHLVPFVDASDVMHGIAYLSVALLLLCVVLLGGELLSWTAGIVGAAVLALSTPVLVTTALAFQDVMTAALILLALLLEVRRPRRGAAPLILLGLAGLIRPEVWGLAAAYWLYLFPGSDGAQRLRLALLAAAAPALWVLSDLLLTGELLFSFSNTREGAEIARRTTGISQAPVQLIDNLRLAIGRGPLVGGVVGAGAAAFLLWRRDVVRPGHEVDRRVVIPLATLVLLCGAFLALGLSELSLLERYLIAPAALLALFFGFALTAWRHVAPRTLMVVAVVGAAFFAVDALRGVQPQLDRVDPALDYVRTEHEVLNDLRALGHEMPPLIERCGTVSVSSYRTRPYLAYALERRAREVALVPEAAEAPPRTLWVAPASKVARDGFTLLGRDGGPLPPPPAGFRTAASNPSWAAYARGC